MEFAQMIRRYDDSFVNGMHDGNSWVGAVMTMLIILIIAGVAIYLIRAFAQNNNSGQTEVRDPLDIAKERFAKGEISKEEFNDIKKELK